MAIYEYVCFACHNPKEIKMSFAEYDIKGNEQYCECGGKLSRKVSASSVVYKGEGWFRDGYSGGTPAQNELDRELKVYDGYRDKQEQEKYDRDLTNI